MSRRPVGALVALLAVLSVVVSACGAAPSTPKAEAQEVVVKVSEFAFEPAEIRAKVGQPVRIVLQNDGTLLHDFSSDDAKVEVIKSAGAEHEAHDAQPSSTVPHVAADVGKQATLEFMPTEAGTYTFYCSVEGHKEAGMVGRLIVTE